MENLLDGLFGKTCLEPSAPIPARISLKSSDSTRRLPTPTYMFLNLKQRTANLLGDMPGGCWEMDGLSHGELSMRNTGEYPSAAAESTLSSILEVNVPEKYYLSAKACAGILRRAEKRGKELPPMLKEALEEVVSLSKNEPESLGGAKGYCLVTEQASH